MIRVLLVLAVALLIHLGPSAGGGAVLGDSVATTTTTVIRPGAVGPLLCDGQLQSAEIVAGDRAVPLVQGKRRGGGMPFLGIDPARCVAGANSAEGEDCVGLARPSRTETAIKMVCLERPHVTEIVVG